MPGENRRASHPTALRRVAVGVEVRKSQGGRVGAFGRGAERASAGAATGGLAKE